jgi:beta-lactamase regulating signal transducer with metallopeptidase domain
VEAVANWLWQGIVVAMAAALLVRVPRSLGATARYRLWWAAMAIVLALPVAPFIAASWLPGTGALDAMLDMPPPRGAQVRIAAPEWAAVVLASVWGLWVAVTATRVLSALVGLRRARRAAQPFPEARASRLTHWSAVSTGGRRAALVISGDVRYAAVLGGRTPAIAISPAAAAALEDRDLDRIVVHEWAHVQRRDDRARLVQLIVRAVAGLHPGVWWLDRQIHIDRETACDDWAVNVTGSAKSYAASLTRLAAIDPMAREDVLQPAAIASSDLTRRVMRLLDDRRTTSTRRGDAASALVVPALCLAACGVAGVPLIAIDRAGTAAQSNGARVPRCQGASCTSAPLPSGTFAPLHLGTLAPLHLGTLAPLHPATPAPSAEPVTRPSRADARTTRQERPEPIQVQPPASVPSTPTAPGRAEDDRRRVSDVHGEIPRGLGVDALRDLPGAVTSPGIPTTEPAGAPPQAANDSAPKSPWGAAADAGVNVGRGSQKAAVATAGFFSKLGKSIARSF